MNSAKHVLLFLIILSISGCAIQRVGQRERTRELVIPAGVDSLIAASADSTADSLFVDLHQQTEAKILTEQGKEMLDRSDSLWNLINTRMDTSKKISEEDKEKAIEAYNRGAKKIQEIVEINSGQVDSVDREVISSQIFQILLNAQESFETSLQLNPFDTETRTWLAWVYESVANRFKQAKKYEDAVITLKNLIRVNKGEPELYYRLGINYFFLKRWQDAYMNFKKAEEMLLQTAFIQMDSFPADSIEFKKAMNSVPVDTTQLFNIIYFQADAEAKMYEAQAALASLERALKIAPSQKEVNDIIEYIKWIKWDDGNISASEMNDYYYRLYMQGKYEKATEGYKKLLKELKTQRAKDQVNWTVATIEFQHLNKKEQGISRLMKVVKRTIKDQNGAPIDTTYRRYFADYGIMCHNMGIEHLKKNPKIAFIYFKQAVLIDSPIRGKSYIELAKLSRSNPGETIEKCHIALEPLNNLTLDDQIQVYQLLVEGYIKQGKIEKAKEYFMKWKLLEQKREQKNG